MSQEKLARRVLLGTPTGSGPEVHQGPDGVITSPTGLSRVEPAEISEVAENREAFRVLQGLVSPRPSPKEKQKAGCGK